MRSRLVPWVLLAGFIAPTWAHAECTYDESAQLAKIVGLAQRVDGRIGAGGHSVRWREGAATLEVIYGGCDHLGHTVSREIPATTALSQPELLAAALQMAQQQWGPAEAEMLREALREQRFTRTQTGAKTFFHLAVPDYFEFNLTHGYVDGIERVEIQWARNF